MKKDKPINKVYRFNQTTARPITIVIGLISVNKKLNIEGNYAVAVGWSICRPGDNNKSELGETIATGRLKKCLTSGKASSVHVIKPSIATLSEIAKDYYHYMINHPDEFYTEKKPEEEVKETEAVESE